MKICKVLESLVNAKDSSSIVPRNGLPIQTRGQKPVDAASAGPYSGHSTRLGMTCHERAPEGREHRGQMQRIPTLAEIEFSFVVFTEPSFLYQEIGPKILRVHELGMNCSEIGKAPTIDGKTVKKAIDFAKRKAKILPNH